MNRRIAELAALVITIEFIIVFFVFPSFIIYAVGIAVALILIGFVLLAVGMILVAPFFALLEVVNWASGRPGTISGLQRRAEADAPSKGGKHG